MTLSYQHEAFVRRVVKPAAEVLGRQSLHHWIEASANELFESSQLLEFLNLGKSVTDKLNVELDIADSSRRNSDGAREHWTASIDLKPDIHAVKVRTTHNARDRNALVAHELGHALLYNNERLWKRIASNKLLVDPAQERLVDDIARAILLPLKLLENSSGQSLFRNGLDSVSGRDFNRLIRLTEIPTRLMVARILQVASRQSALAIQVAVPRQLELSLFDTEKSLKRPTVRNLFIRTPTPSGTQDYPLVDCFKIYKTLKWDEIDVLLSMSGLGFCKTNDMIFGILKSPNLKAVSDFCEFRVVDFYDALGIQQIVVFFK